MRKAAQTASPTTAKDIAREVGLSQPTVSRILADADGFRVTAETRKRVVDTARRMNYRPNALARSLRQRRTNVIGFYTEDPYLDATNYFLSAIVGGVQRAADVYDMDVLLYRGDASSSSEKLCRNLMDRRIDGLVVHTSENSLLVANLRKAELPVVAITDAISGIPSVVCDDAGGMKMLIDHLWSKGHRRIAFLRSSRRFYSVDARSEAFVAEMCLRGAKTSGCPVIPIDMEMSAEALPYIMSLANRPTAICCWNDMTAYNLLYACRQSGVSVPDDLAIVGFDGFHDPKMMAWSLVTISASWNAVASQAMHTLVELINEVQGSDVAVETAGRRLEVPEISRLPVKLVPGTTA